MMTDPIEICCKASGIAIVNKNMVLMGLNREGTYELPGGRRDPTSEIDMLDSSITALRETGEETKWYFEMWALFLILTNPRYIQLTVDGKWSYVQYFMRSDTLDKEFVQKMNAHRKIHKDPRKSWNEILEYRLVDWRKPDVPIRARDAEIFVKVQDYFRIVQYFTPSVESVHGFNGVLVTLPKIDKPCRPPRARKPAQAKRLHKLVLGQ